MQIEARAYPDDETARVAWETLRAWLWSHAHDTECFTLRARESGVIPLVIIGSEDPTLLARLPWPEGGRPRTIPPEGQEALIARHLNRREQAPRDRITGAPQATFARHGPDGLWLHADGELRPNRQERRRKPRR